MLAALMSNRAALIKLQSTKVEMAPPPVILDIISNFLIKFNPSDADRAASQFYFVASAFADYILSGQAEPIAGIRPLMIAIKKIQENDH